MWKSAKFILATALVAVMLVGGTAGVALAQGEDDGRHRRGAPSDEIQGRRDALMARVAGILNIDQQDLESAFTQAQSELREEALDNRLQELIDEGTLTREQADEFKEWIKARPDVPRIGPGRLQELVDEGILSQEQMDEFTEWLEARPDVPRLRHKRFGPRDSGQMAR